MSAVDFNLPQRQSPTGVLIMFFDTVRQFARALWPILVITFIRLDELDKFMIAFGILSLLAVIGLVAYLKYRNFTFRLDRANDEFVISEGVFNKTRTVIRLDRIQQVNISQSLIQRLINVYAVEVDTAGSSASEAKIKAVTHDLAVRLKAALLESDNTFRPVDAQIDPMRESAFLHIDLATLVKIGITSNYVKTFGLILAFLITVWENLRHYSELREVENDQFSSRIEGFIAMQPVMAIGLLVMLVVLLVNLIRTVVRYYNFTIKRQGGSLLLSFGLLNIRSTILRPGRVQIAAVSRNYFQKKMGISELRVRQAGVPEDNERKSAVEIPGCNDVERDAILKLIFEGLPKRGQMLKPNFRRLVFAIFLAIVLPLCGFIFIVTKIGPEAEAYFSAIPVYVLFTGLILWFSFRNSRLFLSRESIIMQSGAWDISNEMISPEKIQAITVSQLFWHKSLNIGTLSVHTAGGTLTFRLGNFETMRNYVNLWLFDIESSNRNWM